MEKAFRILQKGQLREDGSRMRRTEGRAGRPTAHTDRLDVG